jgi:LuxR family quorum-sensing transcriptional regulator LasR
VWVDGGMELKASGMQRIYQVALNTKSDILKTEPSLGDRLLEFKDKTRASIVCLQAMLRTETDHHYVMTTAFKRHFERYVDERTYLTDPIFQQCATSRTPFEWSVMTACADDPHHELMTGHRWLTIPIMNDNVIACIHVASEADEETWRSQIADFIWHGGAAGDEIVARLLSLRSKEYRGRVRLTPVQVDYLSLLAAGKDIGDIVKLTRQDHRSVNRQISDALSSLNARTQSQAVVKAISLGILSPQQ